MDIAKFQYKCRKCSHIIEIYETAAARADKVLCNVIHNIAPYQGLQPNMVEIHDECHGIMDLIGYKIYEEL